MSFEKNQYNQAINKNISNTDNINREKENNLLLKPIAIKQNILANNPPPNNINKYQNVSILYQNQPTNQYLKEISQINYIKTKDNEIMKYNSNEIPNINNITNNEKGAFSLIANYTNNNNTNNINNINNINNTNKINYIKNESMEPNNKIHCTCKKTKCIKKYCECYSSKVYCQNCKCENCENKPYLIDNNNNNSINKKEEEINESKIIKQISDSDIICDINDNYLKKLIICTCSKSGCNKNYCECFKAKVKCNNKCRCIKCLNKPDDTIPLDEEKMITKSISAPISNTNNNNTNNNNINNVNNVNNVNNNFTVHRISVNINKKQTEINIEKLDYFDSNKFLSKKRSES